MSFISSPRQSENEPRASYQSESSWGDTYGAALGLVFDEELSVSSMLNRDGFEQRRAAFNELRSTEGFNSEPYRRKNVRGETIGWDWDRLNQDYPDQIPTTAAIEADRNELLRQKREFSRTITENGPATAQFLGAMNGYLLDPISMLTMPVSYSVKTAQGVSLAHRIAYTSGRAAAVEGATEAAIQPLVFEYKDEIDSEYEAKDAIAAIATAAIGGAALGGATEGIAGYLRSVRKKAQESNPSRSEQAALDQVERTERLLDGAPVDQQQKVLNEVVDHLEEFEQPKIRSSDQLDSFESSPIKASKVDDLTPDPPAKKNIIQRAIDRVTGGDDADVVKTEEPKVESYSSPKQGEVLTRVGAKEDYDSIIQEYQKIETRRVYDGEDFVDADDVISEIDSEVNGLENVMRCVRGG